MKKMLLLCEATSAFILSYILMCFCYSKIHLRQLGQLELIKTMLKSSHVLLGLSQVWNRYLKGSHNTWAT